MTDPVQAAAAVTQVVDAIKRARDVAKRLKNAEIQALLLDAQEQALSLREELLSLRAENLDLRSRLDARRAVIFDGGAYWSGVGDQREGPYCQRCHDADQKQIRLVPTYDYWHACPECENTFEVTSAPRRPRPPDSGVRYVRE